MSIANSISSLANVWHQCRMEVIGKSKIHAFGCVGARQDSPKELAFSDFWNGTDTKTLIEGEGELDLEPLDLLSHSWEYRGEGNANVVVALQNENQVIRFSKVDVGQEPPDLRSQRRKMERELDFANFIFRPLAGPEFVGKVKAVVIPLDQISELNRILQKVRPTFRLHKEIATPFATVHDDFARIQSISRHSRGELCVEIKPKQGWWSGVSSNSVDSRKCAFCLNQYLKIKRGMISSKSLYCPLDLFSGNPDQMVEAVTALIATPQNNFRIFCDGHLVYGEGKDASISSVLNAWFGCGQCYSCGNLNNFIFLLCKSLLTPKNSAKHNASLPSGTMSNSLLHPKTPNLKSRMESTCQQRYKSTCGTHSVCNNHGATLPDGCVLSRILNIQKLAQLEKSGKVYPSICKIFQKLCAVHSHSKAKEQQCPSKLCVKEDLWLDEVNVGKLLSEQERSILEHYLVAATAKDCSIMVTLSPVTSSRDLYDIPDFDRRGALLISDLSNNLFHVRIGVADLEPKPVTTVARHYLRDEEIMQAYSSFDWDANFEFDGNLK